MKDGITTAQAFEAARKGDFETVEKFISQRKKVEEIVDLPTKWYEEMENGQTLPELVEEKRKENLVGPSLDEKIDEWYRKEEEGKKLLEELEEKKQKEKLDTAKERIVESTIEEAVTYAAQNNQKDTLKKLLINNTVNNEALSAVFYEIIKNSGDIETVKMLIEASTDINIKNNRGQALLHVALDNKRTDVVKLLIKKGVDINAQDASGHTALHSAARLGKTDVVDSLIKVGADLNIKTGGNYYTPLLLAIESNQLDVAKKLIEARADVDIADRVGRTPLDMLMAKKNEEFPPTGVDDTINLLLKESSKSLNFKKVKHDAGMLSVVKLAVNKLLNSVGIKTNVAFAYNGGASVSLKFSKSSKAAAVEPNPKSVINSVDEISKEKIAAQTKESSKTQNQGQTLGWY